MATVSLGDEQKLQPTFKESHFLVLFFCLAHCTVGKKVIFPDEDDGAGAAALF